MKKICSFTFLYLFHSALCLDRNNETLRRVDCLLDLEFYHPESDQCFPALEQGPCDQDEWLLPDLSDPGLGRCQRMSVARGCEAIILESGEVGCREDLEDENDVAFLKVNSHIGKNSEYSPHLSLFQGNCDPGELLMPANFVLNTLSCPEKYHCSTIYKDKLISIKIANGNNALARKGIDHFRNLKCKLKNPRALCIPDNKQSLLDPENIFQSFKNPKLICKKNPCSRAQKPTLNEDGYYVCGNILGLNSLTYNPKNKCTKRQRFSALRGRCIPRFLG